MGKREWGRSNELGGMWIDVGCQLAEVSSDMVKDELIFEEESKWALKLA